MGAMNELINRDALARLEGQLTASGAASSFAHLHNVELDPLSLRERADAVSAALLADLELDYAGVAALFRAALEQPGFGGWTMWPVGETVVTAALREGAAEFDDAMRLLGELTPRLSSEFSIRRLLVANPDRALELILPMTLSDDEHVRRFASEGTRPFLPWAIRVAALVARPEATVPILDALYRDESEYVRRSVANHLNDLSREHPELVVDIAGRWMSRADANTPRLVKHALRTLVKKGYPPALELLGFGAATVTVSVPVLDAVRVQLPGSLGFRFDVTNTGDSPATLAVDYAVHYVKSNGSRAAKVFKLASATIEPGASASFSKRHAFRQMTTRVHYPGAHALEVQVNGERFGAVEFDVVTPG